MLKGLQDDDGLDSGCRRVMFRKHAPIGSVVYLAGDFNDWSTSEYPMVDVHGTGDYVCCVKLCPGIYGYKFLVNGVWCMDDTNGEFTISGIGTYNNVIEVRGNS